MAADYSRGFVKHFSSAFRKRSKEKVAGAYDDVLIKPSSFTPLVRDYAEIFNIPQPSSIPVLELDQLGFDNSSKVDYGNVFGDGQIGWTHVFCVADGTRRTDDSPSHSRGSDHSTALEESQKQSLFGREHNMSSDKTQEENVEEKAKNMDVSILINAIDETIDLKDLKRCSDEALVRKHSRRISSGGLSRYGTDGFIEIDVRSRTEYVTETDKSIYSGKSIEADTIRSEERIFEEVTLSDFVLNFGSPNDPFKEQASLRSNDSEDPCDVSTSSSQEGVKTEGLEKSLIIDSATDDNLSRQNPLTQDHGGACSTPEILMGNLNAHSSNASEKAEDGSYNSHQDVEFQAASGLVMSFISSHQINASVAIPQESSGPASQTDFGTLNTAAEADIVSEVFVSRNAYSECNDKADLQNKVVDEFTSIDLPVDTKLINLGSQSYEKISPSAFQCNHSNVGPDLKNSTLFQYGGSEKRTDSSAPNDHVPSSSDDEVDKNSEVGIYVSAVKRAIKESQVWIKIAKESNGVKGFMKPGVTKAFEQDKEFKEVRASKVNEISKFYKLGQTTIANNCRMSAARKEYMDPCFTNSDIKPTLTNNDDEDRAFKGTIFCVSDRQHQKVDTSLEEKIEVASTIQYVTPCINNEECLKSVPEKQHVGMVEEAHCYEVPKFEKEILGIPTNNRDTLLNSFEDTNTVKRINEAVNSYHTTNLRGQGFMKTSFGQSQVGWSAINVEVNDMVSGTGHMPVHPKQNEGTTDYSESNGTPRSGNYENDLTTLEEGRVNEMQLDHHGQVFDCEDFQGYASAEEDLVSSDTDDEIQGKYSNVPAQNQNTEIKDTVMQNMLAPEVISIRENVFGRCFSNLNEDAPAEESCESEIVPLQNTVTHETRVNPKEMSALIFVNSTEDSVVGEGGEKKGKQLQTTVVNNVASSAMTELFFKISENDAVGKDTSEDDIPPCLNCVDEYPRSEDTDGVDAMIGNNMVIPEENNISMNDNNVFLSFDHSNVDLMIEADMTRDSIVSSLYQEFNGVAGDKISCIHDKGVIEAEIIEKSHETENVKSFINDQVSIDAAAQQVAIDLESTPLYPEHDTQEVEASVNFCEPLSDIIMHDKAIEFEQQGDKLISEPVEEKVNFSKPLTVIITNDETTEFEMQVDNWISEHLDSGVEPGKQICEPLPDTIKREATCEFEKQGGTSVQPMERHERRKWEIPEELFELPEMKIGILEIRHIGEKDTVEVKRQLDKHVRKKWEIPMETFELPVLSGNGILEEVEEIECQNRDHSANSAEKPERKKWKVLNEVYEAPVLFGEEMMMHNLPTNLMHSGETSQDYTFQNEMYPKEELGVPINKASSGFCVDSLEVCLTKKSLLEMKIPEVNETSDRLEAKVEEGKSDKQGECAKMCEDVNVKDEIKRTLGMLWKRIYNSKHDEDFETVEFGAQKEDVFGRVVDKDLNLNGPVELVESPKQQDIAFFNSSGQSSRSNDYTEETSYLKQFQVNGSNSCSSIEFVSTTRVTVGVQGNTSSASDSCELQEDGKKSGADKTSDPTSHSEDFQPLKEYENQIKMEQTHGAYELLRGQEPKIDIFPSDVKECDWTYCEIMSRFETLQHDDSLKSNVENAQKVNLVFQENGSNEDETIKTTSTGKALQDNDDGHYLEDEVEALLADEISGRTIKNSEQQDMTSMRQDSVSVLDSRVADDMPSHEPKPNSKDEFGSDSSWKGLFREEDEFLDKNPNEKADIKKVAGEINTSQLTVKEKLDDENPSKADLRAKEGFHNDVTLNQEVLQNILRAKERERIVVERAIREVRDRAVAKARERADMERAKEEARQKSVISNQEKLENALIETKLAAEEISLETKRNAELERAAVERATSEARQRALEKALCQKDQTSQSCSSGLTDASDYHYGSTSEDRHNDVDSSETALRFKATNERHQRIAERTAKALDEKNMRDLLLQREQAERNSLAELLDAEVKRWANGKTGNLRALLSTLQYVLGPDSGWTPVHLTDIVTTDSLKKAYRKATLFVHPDKLQQRGANIKQKYICEKVFDLLKEAWKRVGRDEL